VKEKRDGEAGGTGGGAPDREGEGIEITRRGIWISAAALSGLRRSVATLLTGALIGSGATLSAMRIGTPADPPPPATSDRADADSTAADSPRVCASAQCACPD
jgi:hypothetical protein